jgi:hypothetical protein
MAETNRIIVIDDNNNIIIAISCKKEEEPRFWRRLIVKLFRRLPALTSAVLVNVDPIILIILDMMTIRKLLSCLCCCLFLSFHSFHYNYTLFSEDPLTSHPSPIIFLRTSIYTETRVKKVHVVCNSRG